MSMVDLAIGTLPPDLEEAALEKEERLGVPHMLEWERYAGPTEEIGLLNLASIVFFTDYVASLEGRSQWDGPHESRFKNLPSWETNIWLPGRFEASDEVGDDYTFLGSCAALLDELTEIQRTSKLSLGVVIPDRYREMRADFRAYCRSSLEPSTPVADDDVIRWIWQGLWDGAEMAVRKRAPMLGLMS